jgi:carbon monoxide dehydrogenase subunit G
VAPCLPGAAITGRDDDGTYHGTFQVKLGPTTAAYRGTIAIDETDESAHRATLKARGTDKRGQGGASATIVNTLTEDGGATRVEAVTDFTITGRLAAFGRGGMMKDISNRLMKDFATCLQSRLGEAPAGPQAPPEPAAATPGVPPTEPPAPEPPHDLHPGGGPRAGASPPPPARPAAPPPPGRPAAPPPPAPPAPPAPAPAKPVNGLSLFLGVLVERIKRLLGRGGG